MPASDVSRWVQAGEVVSAFFRSKLTNVLRAFKHLIVRLFVVGLQKYNDMAEKDKVRYEKEMKR